MEIKILKDKITQKDFEKVAKNFENDKSFRGSIWYRCRRLLIDGYFYESYALFLATWNFARFRYELTKLKSMDFENMIQESEIEFKKIENHSIRDINLEDEKLVSIIKSIYTRFRQIKGIEITGAAKLKALKQ